jgi:hypothetical protein
MVAWLARVIALAMFVEFMHVILSVGRCGVGVVLLMAEMQMI